MSDRRVIFSNCSSVHLPPDLPPHEMLPANKLVWQIVREQTSSIIAVLYYDHTLASPRLATNTPGYLSDRNALQYLNDTHFVVFTVPFLMAPG